MSRSFWSWGFVQCVANAKDQRPKTEDLYLEELMLWIVFAFGAALAWGLYGPALHQGQVQLGSPMRALLCVGYCLLNRGSGSAY